METMKVKPWGEGQGDFVVINAEDFDPKVHTPLNEAKIVKGVEVYDPRPAKKRK